MMSPSAQGTPRAPGWALQLIHHVRSQGRLRAGPSLQQIRLKVLAKVKASLWPVRYLSVLGGGAGIASLRFRFKVE